MSLIISTLKNRPSYPQSDVTMPAPKPSILFIDAYDSFSNNIISLLAITLQASIRTIHIDNPALATDNALHTELRHYEAVVCGPGPGHPAKEEDIGIMRRIWRLRDQEMMPVLGICLGFQSLCLEFGGRVGKLRGPQHGMVRKIAHIGEGRGREPAGIFEGVGEVNATLYQSLCVDIGQHSIGKDEWEELKWETTSQCPDLLPMAWVEHDFAEKNDSGILDQRVLVGVQHRTKPFWALQYHPESICTNKESEKVISNWFNQAHAWNTQNRRPQATLERPIEGQFVTRESLLSQSHRSLGQDGQQGANGIGRNKSVCHSRTIEISPHISVPEIVETIQDLNQDQIILESSNANEKPSGGVNVRGRYSIIGLDIDHCVRVEYTAGKRKIAAISPRAQGLAPEIALLSADQYAGIWPYLAQYLEERKVKDGNPDSPFWGGFMGYTTYELGLESIGVTPDPRGRQHERPDLCFAWVEKSLIVDHVKNRIYLQQLAPPQASTRVMAWMDAIVNKLEAKFFPKESHHPYAITFSNLPVEDPKSQIINKMIEMGITLPQTILAYCSTGPYAGLATARYRPRNDLRKIARLMNNTTINGCKIQAQVEGKPPSLPLCPHLPVLNPPSLPPPKTTTLPAVLQVQTPKNEVYESKVLACQSSIRAGNSYELCLTDQTLVTLSSSSTHTNTPWSLYQNLRTLQPAPFASFLRLGPLTFLSASPELFLTFTPQTCELRPMKGTVRKSAQVSTLAAALPLLEVPKEKAENLMIVDLVRHDLHGVCGAGGVKVPRLMVVEEYKSVFQMISVVQGTIPSPAPVEETDGKADPGGYGGLDILSASLPPGSMTGAPKKRSCEILQQVEGGRERSLYSGVVGFADVGGRGEWSVNIRCTFKWADEDGVIVKDGDQGGDSGCEKGQDSAWQKVDDQNSMRTMRTEIETETWHIGAGGAVTALSTSAGERKEMLTKLEGTLGLFG
ncbi:aminodeoxychorismate synthase [Diplocarpon rosae]|nr:aminodeoxychorismate synthase [Diplocarpon rosae]